MKDVYAISNFFIEKGLETQQSICPVKLQRLLYFSYGWYAGIYGKKLFSGKMQACNYGPRINKIYHKVKRYGNSTILFPIELFLYGNKMTLFSLKLTTPRVTNEFLRDFLNEIWEVYAKHDVKKLSALAHIEGSPWYRTLDSKKISHSEIEKYFSDLLTSFKK